MKGARKARRSLNVPRSLQRAVRSENNFVYRLVCTESGDLVFEVGEVALNSAKDMDMHPLVLRVTLEQLAMEHLAALKDEHIQAVRSAMPENLMFQEGMPGMTPNSEHPAANADIGEWMEGKKDDA